MRLRVVLGLSIAAIFSPVVAGASTGAPGPRAAHEQPCNRTHSSTAPDGVNQAMHERVPPSAMNQLCNPHGGHGDDGRPGDDASR